MSKRKTKKVLIQTEASSTIGMGHLVRCLSLAKMLKSDFDVVFLLPHVDTQIKSIVTSEGFKINFIENELTGYLFLNDSDIVVLDGYNFNSEYQKKIKEKSKILVCIDDIHAYHFYADVIINASDVVSKNDYSAEPFTQYLLGSNYALLRDVFIDNSRKLPRLIKSVDSIFISMGGADSGNVSLKILKSIQSIGNIKNVHLVIGAVNQHQESLTNFINEAALLPKVHLYKDIDALKLSSVLNECQIAICPASGISLEAAAIGIGIISGYTAKNQLGILNGLIANECICNAGDFNSLTHIQLRKIIEDNISNLDVINAMILKQKKLIDGSSPQRIVSIFKQLTNDN